MKATWTIWAWKAWLRLELDIVLDYYFLEVAELIKIYLVVFSKMGSHVYNDIYTYPNE